MASSLQQQQQLGGVAAGRSGSNNGGSGSGPLGGPLSGSGSGAVGAGAGALASGSSTQKARTAPSAPSELRQPNLPATTPAHQQQPPPTQQGPTVLTFALNHRPRATRASVPKVRTGCKTCKKRHVKCDEAKPSCSRCIKWQGFCEGYDQAAESASNDAATHEAASQPATTTATAPTTTARPKTTPRATPTTTPAGTPPGASKTPRNRNPTKTCPNANPTAKTTRAPSTTSSSSATQNSRRTTPSSDVSASEYVHTTTAQPLPTNTLRTSTPSIKREPDDDTPRAQYGDQPIYVGDDDSNASVIFIPREPVYVQTQQQTQRQFKREYDDEDDVEAEYYTHDAYAPDFVVAQRNTSTQPFFDLSLINGGGTSSSFPLEPNYNSVMFASQWEKAYFDSWLTLAPNLGGGWFPSHLWTSTIPQLCRDEPAVRFAAIAIGAMAQAMSPALLGKSYHHMLGGNTTADGQPSQPGQPGADGTASAFPVAESVEASRVVPHYRNALTYYGHALRLLRLGGGGGTATSENNNGNQPQQPYTGNDPETPPSSEKERAAVLSCLLFVCFEALQGNREAALHHITHGLQIVDQFVARNLPPRALSEAQAYSPPDEASLLAGTDSDAEWQRRRQRQRQRDRQLGLLAAKQGEAPTNAADNSENGHRTTLSEDRPSDSLTRVLTRSPAPYVLEDEVMQVFRRLDFQAWSLGVFRLRRTRPADIKFQALDALNPATIPARFDTLDDARRWWDFVQHWILQFPRYMVAALQRYMDENPDAAARATAAGRMLDICDVPGAREIQREYLECLERWYAAFYPLYEATRRQGGHPTYGHGGDPAAAAAAEAAYFRAASLKIPYLLAWIGVSSLVYSDYEAMYQLTPQFRELNRLAALILPKQPRYAWSPFGGGASSIFGPPPGGASGGSVGSDGVRGDLFTMDNGPTMALFVVSCKCRVEAVRDESIRLLAAYPRRDGFWDSKILWAIADWNRVIEAENETEGSLYEQWLRLRQREAIFDETKPEVQMTAWVKNAATGKFEKLTQTVRWDR